MPSIMRSPTAETNDGAAWVVAWSCIGQRRIALYHKETVTSPVTSTSKESRRISAFSMDPRFKVS